MIDPEVWFLELHVSYLGFITIVLLTSWWDDSTSSVTELNKIIYNNTDSAENMFEFSELLLTRKASRLREAVFYRQKTQM